MRTNLVKLGTYVSNCCTLYMIRNESDGPIYRIAAIQNFARILLFVNIANYLIGLFQFT